MIGNILGEHQQTVKVYHQTSDDLKSGCELITSTPATISTDVRATTLHLEKLQDNDIETGLVEVLCGLHNKFME